MLVDARLMGECIAPDHGLVELDRVAGALRNQPGCLEDLLG
jgi:hypothetical protein